MKVSARSAATNAVAMTLSRKIARVGLQCRLTCPKDAARGDRGDRHQHGDARRVLPLISEEPRASNHDAGACGAGDRQTNIDPELDEHGKQRADMYGDIHHEALVGQGVALPD